MCVHTARRTHVLGTETGFLFILFYYFFSFASVHRQPFVRDVDYIFTLSNETIGLHGSRAYNVSGKRVGAINMLENVFRHERARPKSVTSGDVIRRRRWRLSAWTGRTICCNIEKKKKLETHKTGREKARSATPVQRSSG